MKRSLLERLFVSPIDDEGVEFDGYLKLIRSGQLKDRMFYGIAEDKRGFLIFDPVLQPGFLCVGGMGSGKSIAARTILVTHMCSNSENTFYLLVDALKGMTDFAPLFEYSKNVATALNDAAKIVPVIDMVHAEFVSRKIAFSKVNANNIYAYDKIMKERDPKYPGTARILIMIEEFHSVCPSDAIKFHQNSDRPDTPAFQLKELMRVGRSYGIQLGAASQRATSDDFPSSLKPGITQVMAFKVNNPGDASMLNLSGAADIRAEQRGRCVYEGGLIQFPWIPDGTAKSLLGEFYKPLTHKLLSYQPSDYQTALAGEGNSGMVWVKPLKSVLGNIGSYKFNDFVTRVLMEFDFKVTPQDNKALVATMIAERDGERIAVLALPPGSRGDFGGRSSGLSPKTLESFKNSIKMLNCEGAIVITGESGGSVSSVDSGLKGVPYIYVDGEDLARIADVIDNKADLTENGQFESLYGSLSLARPSGEDKVPEGVPGAPTNTGGRTKTKSPFEDDDF